MCTLYMYLFPSMIDISLMQFGKKQFYGSVLHRKYRNVFCNMWGEDATVPQYETLVNISSTKTIQEKMEDYKNVSFNVK